MTVVPFPRQAAPAPIAHAAWERARVALVTRASSVGTQALLGDCGTGKTWMLRALAREAQASGWQVELVRQGDFEWSLSPGKLLLIDEASCLDAEALALLSRQRIAPVIIAGLPSFGARLDGLGVQVVTLDRLTPDETVGFAQRWLEHAGVRAVPLTEAALRRIADSAEGIPRLAVQFLNATAAMAVCASASVIDGSDVDDAVSLRLGGMVVEPAPASPQPRRRRKTSHVRRRIAALAASAVAAGVVLTLMALGEPGGVSALLHVSATSVVNDAPG